MGGGRDTGKRRSTVEGLRSREPQAEGRRGIPVASRPAGLERVGAVCLHRWQAWVGKALRCGLPAAWESRTFSGQAVSQVWRRGLEGGKARAPRVPHTAGLLTL